MKFKSIQLFVCGITIGLLSIGCSSETDLPIENKGTSSNIVDVPIIQNSEIKMFKKETSLLVGRLLSNKEVRDEVLMRMKEVSDDGELVSFGYLLGKNKGIRKVESNKLASKDSRKNSLFAQALENELATNIDEYPTTAKLIAKEKVKSVTSRYAEPIDPYTNENLQIYSPYNEVNEMPEATYETYYTSEEMEDGSPTNSGFYFDGDINRPILKMDNNLIDTNPSFIISAIDEEDLVGGVSTTTELFAATMPPPLTTGPTLLTYSVNHNDIPDLDIISTRIPMIKINGNSWLGFGSTHQKLRIYRGSYEGGVTQNANGTISVTGLKFQIGSDFKTARKNVKKDKWLTFDTEFDPDWNQSENSEQIVIFSLHHWRADKTVDVSVKYGLKQNATGGWEGTPEATGSASVKVTSSSCIFRANAELSRRQVLSTIVGSGATGKTCIDAGVEYNVKSVGIIDYYFKHLYTDL